MYSTPGSSPSQDTGRRMVSAAQVSIFDDRVIIMMITTMFISHCSCIRVACIHLHEITTNGRHNILNGASKHQLHERLSCNNTITQDSDT